MFSINTCIGSGLTHNRMHIIAADKVIGTTYNYNTHSTVCTTGTGVAVLKTGDKVWVKFVTGSSGTCIYEDDETWNSFSGQLINNNW